jgi:hypothetical protein
MGGDGMSHVQEAFRESTLKKKDINPIWRGIGFILLILLTVGAFWLAGYILDNQLLAPYLPFAIPRDFTVTIVKWLPTLPGKPLVQIGAAMLLDVLAYALMVVLYAIVNPIRLGPTDAKQPRGRGRKRSLVR